MQYENTIYKCEWTYFTIEKKSYATRFEVKSFSLFLVPIDIWEIFLKHHPRFISMVAIKEARKKEEKVHSISSGLVHRLGKNYPRVKE